MPVQQHTKDDQTTLFYVDLSRMETNDRADLLYRLENLGMKFVIGEADKLRMIKPEDDDKATQVQELFRSYNLVIETKRERIGEP